MSPQPPGGGGVEIEQRPQRDALPGRAIAEGAIGTEADSLDLLAGHDSCGQGVEEVAQQIRGHAAGVLRRGGGDLGEHVGRDR